MVPGLLRVSLPYISDIFPFSPMAQRVSEGSVKLRGSMGPWSPLRSAPEIIYFCCCTLLCKFLYSRWHKERWNYLRKTEQNFAISGDPRLLQTQGCAISFVQKFAFTEYCTKYLNKDILDFIYSPYRISLPITVRIDGREFWNGLFIYFKKLISYKRIIF